MNHGTSGFSQLLQRKLIPCSRPVSVFHLIAMSALQEPFSWTRQWYPLAFVEYLDPKVCPCLLLSSCQSHTKQRHPDIIWL